MTSSWEKLRESLRVSVAGDLNLRRRVGTSRLVFAMLAGVSAILMIVSTLVLRGADRDFMVAVTALTGGILGVALLLLRRRQLLAANLFAYGTMLASLVALALIFETIPPGAELGLVVFVMSTGFTQSVAGVAAVYLATSATAVLWMTVGVRNDMPGAMSQGLISLVFLLMGAGLAVIGSARYRSALEEHRSEAEANEQATKEIAADNEALEVAVQERTRELHQLMALLARQATTDELTGLLSRRGYIDLIGSAQVRAELVWLVMMDLDGLKGWNDEFGHHVGDEVLRVVAAALSTQRGSGVSVARLGGDEFAVICVDKTAAQVRQLCREVLLDVSERSTDDALARLIGPARTLRRPGVSIGYAAVVDGDFEAASQQADAALYHAKRSGGLRVVQAPGPETGVARRTVLPEQNSDGPEDVD